MVVPCHVFPNEQRGARFFLGRGERRKGGGKRGKKGGRLEWSDTVITN